VTTSPEGLTVTTAVSPAPLMATPMLTAMRAASSQLQRLGQVRPHRPSISAPPFAYSSVPEAGAVMALAEVGAAEPAEVAAARPAA